MEGTTSLLRVEGLRVEFDSPHGTVHAVNGTTFSIDQGEVVAFVGESGSGKSATALSLLRLLPREGRVAGGEISFQGRNILKLSETEMEQVRGGAIGIVFQDPMTSLNPTLTIGRQISEAIEVHLGSDRRAARARAVELLELVGIPVPSLRYSQYPDEFSGGMRQRVMIAIALSCAPRLLIADEPTTALDVTVQAQILDLLIRLGRELGMAILLITHDLAVAAQLANRVNVMYAGRIVESGPVDELFTAPAHPYTRGLLGSIPRLDGPLRRPAQIEGVPPDLVSLGSACPFAPRCDLRIAECLVNPALTRFGTRSGHEVACWVAAGKSGEG